MDEVDWVADPGFISSLQTDHAPGPDVKRKCPLKCGVPPLNKLTKELKNNYPNTNFDVVRSESPSDTFESCDSGLSSSSSSSTGLEQQIQNIRLSEVSHQETSDDYESHDSGAEELALTARIHEIIEAVYRQDQDLDTPLHLAVINSQPEIISQILQQTLLQECLDIPNGQGQTPLHLAVITGQANIARTLVTCGACLCARDNEGRTPLHIACERGDAQTIRSLTHPLDPQEILVAKNLNYHIKWQTIPQADDLRNFEGEPVVYTAGKTGRVDVVQYLVDTCGHDINSQEQKGGKTVLHLAIETENTTLLGYLLQHVRTDLYKEDFSQNNPLLLARFHPRSLEALHAFSPHLGETLKERFYDESSDEEDKGSFPLMNGF